jgi:hypothetical protein
MTVLLNHRPYRRYRRLEHIVRISGRLRGHVHSFVLEIDFWRHLFDLPRRSPELPRHPDRINGLSPPPGGLVAKAMVVPVKRSAQRDREFVADLASHRAGLSESQMVGVSGGFCRKLIALLRSRPMAALPLRNGSKLSVQRMRGGTFFRLCAQAHGKSTPNRARQCPRHAPFIRSDALTYAKAYAIT